MSLTSTSDSNNKQSYVLNMTHDVRVGMEELDKGIVSGQFRGKKHDRTDCS